MIERRTYFIAILKKYELLIASGLIIVIVGALAILYLLPNFNRAKLIFLQQLVLKQKYEKLTQKDKALSEIDYKFFQETYPKIGWVLPESKDYVSLFSTFDSLQVKTGVIIRRTSFQLGTISTTSAALARSSNIDSFAVPLSIEVVGDIAQLQKFQSFLSNLSGRLIAIDSSQWKFKKDGTVMVGFKGRAYFYPVPGEIGGIDNPLPSLGKEKEEILKKIAQNNPIETETAGQDKISSGKNNLFQ